MNTSAIELVGYAGAACNAISRLGGTLRAADFDEVLIDAAIEPNRTWMIVLETC